MFLFLFFFKDFNIFKYNFNSFFRFVSQNSFSDVIALIAILILIPFFLTGYC